MKIAVMGSQFQLMHVIAVALIINGRLPKFALLQR